MTHSSSTEGSDDHIERNSCPYSRIMSLKNSCWLFMMHLAKTLKYLWSVWAKDQHWTQLWQCWMKEWRLLNEAKLMLMQTTFGKIWLCFISHPHLIPPDNCASGLETFQLLILVVFVAKYSQAFSINLSIIHMFDYLPERLTASVHCVQHSCGLFKVLGRMVGHSISQDGTGFPYFSLPCYWYRA